jgi:hypothetical protein
MAQITIPEDEWDGLCQALPEFACEFRLLKRAIDDLRGRFDEDDREHQAENDTLSQAYEDQLARGVENPRYRYIWEPERRIYPEELSHLQSYVSLVAEGVDLEEAERTDMENAELAQAPEGAAAPRGRAGTKADRAKRKREREAKIAAYLHDHPGADSPEIHAGTGIPESSIRKSDAWDAREKPKKPAGSRDAMGRSRPLEEPMLAVVPAKGDDPAELAEAHEAEELLERLQTDPEYRSVVESEYRRSIDPSQRAAYKQAEPDEKIQILGVWKITGTPG